MSVTTIYAVAVADCFLFSPVAASLITMSTISLVVIIGLMVISVAERQYTG